MRKKDDALRGTLLQYARETVDTQGTEAINIRALAKQAGVSVGTVYNYFASKDDILLALTEDYWQETLRSMWIAVDADTFVGQVEQVYRYLCDHMKGAAGILMSGLRNVEAMGRERMQSMQQGLGRMLVSRMDEDEGIHQDIWDDVFTKAKYASFILMNIMLLLRMHETDIGFFLALMRKTLYRGEIENGTGIA